MEPRVVGGGLPGPADWRRDQILCRLPGGRFEVVAGTGRRGYAGDGGPARWAELNQPSGMTVGADGTLYFADEDNGRVRAISPAGSIRTVAGGGHAGHHGFVTTGTTALDARFSPTDVAIGPDRSLYIATGEQVLRLGSNTKTLLAVTPDGTLRAPLGEPHGLYPRGNGGLATTSDGGVLAIAELGLQVVSLHGSRTLRSFARGDFLGIHGFSPSGIAVSLQWQRALGHVLGRRLQQRDGNRRLARSERPPALANGLTGFPGTGWA